jgi:hypothetical protein
MGSITRRKPPSSRKYSRSSSSGILAATVAETQWDARVLARSAAVAVLSLGLAWLVTAATDEGGVSWGERAGRTLTLTPACAAIGVWVALAPVHAGREAVAPLGAVWRPRASLARAAVAGSALIACAAAILIATVPATTVTVFFPRTARANSWAWQDGAFVDRAQGLRVEADGTPTLLPGREEVPVVAIPHAGRAAAAMTIACAGLALPLLVGHALLVRSVERPDGGWSTRRGARASPIAVVATLAALATSVVLFQAVAAGNLSALLGATPWAVLLAFALARFSNAWIDLHKK